MSENKENKLDGVRFVDGVTAKAKLIGIEDVKEETGDEICNTSMVKLKAVVLAKKEHKLPITLRISFDGVAVLDQKTNEVLHKHPVDRISYISRDPTDPRAFGYIFKNAKNQLQYIAIKTERPSAEVVLTLKDLFEVVYEMRKADKQKKEETNKSEPTSPSTNVTSDPLVNQTQVPQATNAPPATSGNIFDLDDNVSNQPPQLQQQQNVPTDLFSPPTLAPTKTNSSDNILEFLDTSSTNTTNAANLPDLRVSQSNSELLSMNLMSDNSVDKLAALKATIASAQSANAYRLPPQPPQFQGTFSPQTSYSPSSNPFGTNQFGSPQMTNNLFVPQASNSPYQVSPQTMSPPTMSPPTMSPMNPFPGYQQSFATQPQQPMFNQPQQPFMQQQPQGFTNNPIW